MRWKHLKVFCLLIIKKTNPREFCNILTDEISPAYSSVSNTQRLMQLFLLGYNTHHEVFEKYINVDNAASRFALAQLVGNIKTAQSRNILVALLADENSLVQGEAVRQLKTWPPEDVAPILLAHLKSSSELNSGPSNIMDPVGNSIKGGRAEIIKALGDLKYNEAVPDLLSLLDTNNEYLFELVINALKKIGSKQYVIYINKHLDNKTYSLISSLSMMIAKDSLIECLPSFKNFIATCDRNQNLTEYTISTYSGIGRFKDASTTSFLLADFARFFSYKDTLDCLNERSWTSQYINTFTELGAQAARPLIYKSIYDWFGFNEDFSLQPRLFQIKKNLEDSLRFVFTKKFESEGYSIGRCIAFIQNTGEAAQGRKPSMKFLIECTVPYTKTEGESIRKVIANEVNLPVENVYLRFDNDVYHSEVQYRFSQSLSSTPLEAFLGYAEAMPDSTDVAFLQALVDHNVLPAADDISRIKKVTVSIIQDLQNEKGP